MAIHLWMYYLAFLVSAIVKSKKRGHCFEGLPAFLQFEATPGLEEIIDATQESSNNAMSREICTRVLGCFTSGSQFSEDFLVCP